MDEEAEVLAYRDADFRRVNLLCARRALRVADKTRGRALDLGCGPAEIPILFCGLAPGWKVTAVDASATMLREAVRKVKQARLDRRVQLVRGDAKRLRGLKWPYDLVLSNSLLHHLPDPLPFWREIRRWAAPGTALLIQDLFRPGSVREARRLVALHAGEASRVLRQLFFQSLLAAFTPEEVRAQLREAGLSGLEVRKVSDRHLVIRGKIPGKMETT